MYKAIISKSDTVWELTETEAYLTETKILNNIKKSNTEIYKKNNPL